MKSFALVLAALAACKPAAPDRQLDFKQIEVTTDAKMRTDTVGDGRFAETATFVLVDAKNHATEGAYVTLVGTLGDANNRTVGNLKMQSLWIPAGESRTFALVDTNRAAHPDAISAQVEVKGAVITGFQPVAQLHDVKMLDDVDKVIMQGVLENPSERRGRIIVIGSFHDAAGTPMTRPFDDVTLEPKQRQAVQFVGPKGSKTGQLYVGDEAY